MKLRVEWKRALRAISCRPRKEDRNSLPIVQTAAPASHDLTWISIGFASSFRHPRRLGCRNPGALPFSTADWSDTYRLSENWLRIRKPHNDSVSIVRIENTLRFVSVGLAKLTQTSDAFSFYCSSHPQDMPRLLCNLDCSLKTTNHHLQETIFYHPNYRVKIRTAANNFFSNKVTKKNLNHNHKEI